MVIVSIMKTHCFWLACSGVDDEAMLYAYIVPLVLLGMIEYVVEVEVP